MPTPDEVRRQVAAWQAFLDNLARNPAVPAPNLPSLPTPPNLFGERPFATSPHGEASALDVLANRPRTMADIQGDVFETTGQPGTLTHFYRIMSQTHAAEVSEADRPRHIYEIMKEWQETHPDEPQFPDEELRMITGYMPKGTHGWSGWTVQSWCDDQYSSPMKINMAIQYVQRYGTSLLANNQWMFMVAEGALRPEVWGFYKNDLDENGYHIGHVQIMPVCNARTMIAAHGLIMREAQSKFLRIDCVHLYIRPVGKPLPKPRRWQAPKGLR